MDSRIGLDYIVENPDYVVKLAAALDTNNVIVKKQVIELLSALCVYSCDGYQRAFDALDSYKEIKNERYRLKLIVDELSAASVVDYQYVLIAFINCIVISTPQLKDRVNIRNEFIGLKLLPVLNDIRRKSVGVPELGVQLDVFDEQRESDEAQILQGPYGVDLSSHLDVFYAILRQVADTPQEIPFLSILQHLLRIDPKEPVSDIVWDTAETLVHRATLLENRQDASRLLRSPSIQGQGKFGCHCNCHNHRGSEPNPGSRKQSLNITPATSPPPPPAPGPPPPPPPPPPSVPGPPPPPPPPLAPIKGGGLGPPLPGPNMGGPPPPPMLQSSPAVATDTGDATDANGKLLPQQEIPTPKAKMKTINWNKIPNHKVVGKHNVWSLVARSHQHSPMADLDWAEMEGLFCQQAPTIQPLTTSPRLGRETQDVDKKRKESAEIVLLDGKRSLNVNIFLKQFRTSNDDIIQLIKEGEHDDIGAEKLRGLLKLLPEVDEFEMLKSFDGDKSKLGNAEKFLLQLIQVSNYKLRIESMLLKEEFAANMGYLEPSINAMIVAGEDLTTNKQLQEVLYMVVVAGNFLNFGGYAGNAAGVKLTSLQKLTDIRANKPGMNLIHYVALQAEKKRKELLKFTEELLTLEDATKTTIEQIQNEINVLDSRIKKIRKQIDLPTTESEIKSQMNEFLLMAEQEVNGLLKDMDELEAVRVQLADFFCEDPATFKLEDCFKIFHGFCNKFKQAVAENERRRVQEEQTYLRRRQREEQLAAKRRQLSNGSEGEANQVDNLLYDIRSGFSPAKDPKLRKFQNGSITSEDDAIGSPGLPRKRMGSFSGPPGEENIQEVNSPDITPNGSLRRRRSRVPSEEDDSNLMDFLRASGQDISRERKSWGSLDRSWARRARGGSGRKRPDLLTADFSGERERPASPSPLAENKPLLPNTEHETRPKAWKQKIEAWLQENEKEGNKPTTPEEIRRRNRRIQAVNRRSLEDSESDARSGTLDTLPEEKTSRPEIIGSSGDYTRVYPDWKSTIDKTDVVGAMEAIEDAQPQTPVKDKSIWRKSNLNQANDSEEQEQDPRKLRRLRSREQMNTSLHSIKEEEKRKELISALSQKPAQERLTLYLRRPSNDANEPLLTRTGSLRVPKKTELKTDTNSTPNSPLLTRSQISNRFKQTMDEQNLPPVPRRWNRQRDDVISDKIEIDSDNIETPPVTRRKFGKSRDLSSSLEEDNRRTSCENTDISRGSPEGRSDKEMNERAPLLRNSERLKEIAKRDEEEVLGDGQFERFSSARRTRRYKKNQDTNDQIEGTEASKEVVSPELIPETQILKAPTLHVKSEPVNAPNVDDKEARLKKWKDRLRYHGTAIQSDATRAAQEAITDINKFGAELKNIDKAEGMPSRLGFRLKDDRNERGKSMIDAGHVTEALAHKQSLTRKSNEELSRGKKGGSKNEFIPEIRVQASTPSSLKARNEEYNNDEGFEETQSLVSETPSSSGCNYEADSVDSPKLSSKTGRRIGSLNRADSSGSGDTNTSTSTNPPTRNKSPSKTPSRIETLVARRTDLRTNRLQRSSSVKTTKPESTLKRSSSLRKTDSNSSLLSNKTTNGQSKKRGVERSNSRTSLRSSRSSLNSATSVNTVRNVPALTKTPSQTSVTTRRLAGYTSAIKNLTNNLEKDNLVKTKPKENKIGTFGYRRTSTTTPIKKPLGQIQPKSTKTTVPASRSSSSGSSIGPAIRKPRVITSTPSFKENVAVSKKTGAPASRSNSSDSSLAFDAKNKVGKTVVNIKYKDTTSKLPTQQRQGMNFMKPTAASTAKDTEVPVPKLRSVPKSFLK